jgi:hypothetical protein
MMSIPGTRYNKDVSEMSGTLAVPRPEAVPLRKLPSLWVLAAVTYGLVITVTILSVWAYHRYYPGADSTEIELQKMSARIMVGTVWVPVYPEAMLHDMSASAQGEMTEGVLHFNSTDSPTRLLSFYRAKLKKAGYDVTLAPDTVRASSHKLKSTATITVTPSAAGSEAQVNTKGPTNPSPDR